MRLLYLLPVCIFTGTLASAQVKKTTPKPAIKTAATPTPAKPKIDSTLLKYSIPSRTYTKVDSTYLKWTRLDTGSLEYPWHIGIDAQGRIIALLKDPVRDKRVVMLENGKWKPFQDGIADTPSRVIMDGVGGLYLPTRNNLYKLTAAGWQKLECASVETTGLPVGGRDGKLYKIKKKTSDFVKGAEIVVWKDGCWTAAGKDGNPLMTPGSEFTNFAVDGEGHVYCWESIPYGATDYVQTVHLWNGNRWDKVGQPDMKIYDNGIDGKGRFFVYGFRDDYKKKGRFFSYWDGKAWGDAPYPPETNKDHGVSIITNNAGTMFIEAYPSASGEHDHRLFALEGDLYVRKAEEGKDFDADFNMIPLGNAVYAIDNKSRCFYKYSSGWDVKSTTYTTLPVAMGVEATDAMTNALKYSFLFEENGKKGIKDKDGKVIIRPEYDEIVISAAPTTPPVIEGVTAVPVYNDNAAICLRSGADKTFINLRISSYSLRGYWETPKITCSKCNGAGKGKDQTRQVEVKGEWVKGKSYTTTKSNYEKVWNSRTNSYDGVQTKSTQTHQDPGYRKPSTYRTETIPGETCPACRGKGGASKAEYYRYNESTKRYEARWE